jgi:hypothetical protein
MRGATVIILLCVTAVGACSLGRQDAPKAKPQTAIAIGSPAETAKPVPPPTVPVALPLSPAPSATRSAIPASAPASPEKPPQADIKRKTEVALTAAAIAAIIIKASRDRYYATGHPCACPEDFMRNGRRCGKTSAYSRPGGAAPLCYPTDVSEAMIEGYRKTASASR